MSELFECISLLSSGLARARRATCGRRAGGVDVPAGTCLRVMCLRVTFLRVTCLAPSSPRARPKLAPSSPWAHHFPSVRSGSSRSAREGCVVSYHPDREIIGDSDHGTRTNPRDEIASTPSATSQLNLSHPLGHISLSHPLGHISATPSDTSQPPPRPHLSHPLGHISLSHPLGHISLSHPLGHISATPSDTSQPPPRPHLSPHAAPAPRPHLNHRPLGHRSQPCVACGGACGGVRGAAACGGVRWCAVWRGAVACNTLILCHI